MKMSHFWPISKDISLVFCLKMSRNLNVIRFDCRLKSDENDSFVNSK